MSIYKKLLEVQKEVGAISKDSKNPFFKSKYFDINQLIEHVQPVLSKHGLVLLQPIENNNVVSRIHEAESGIHLSSSLELPNLTKPQDLGSCITYYRRYTLASLLGLQADDNDGNGLKPKPKPVEKIKITKEAYQTAVQMLGEKKVTLDQIKAKYILSPEQEETLSKI
jgi:hypothetical protein